MTIKSLKETPATRYGPRRCIRYRVSLSCIDVRLARKRFQHERWEIDCDYWSDSKNPDLNYTLLEDSPTTLEKVVLTKRHPTHTNSSMALHVEPKTKTSVTNLL